MRRLTTGGSPNFITPNWRVPYGHPGGFCEDTMWVGPMPATQGDIDDLIRMGHGCSDMTLCGTYDIAWHHPCFDFLLDDIAELEPHETVAKPGGDGSWRYKSQNLPPEIDGVSKPRKWLYRADGSLSRSKGGELFEYVDMGDGHIDRHEVADVDVEWDLEKRLWLWVNKPVPEEESDDASAD